MPSISIPTFFSAPSSGLLRVRCEVLKKGEDDTTGDDGGSGDEPAAVGGDRLLRRTLVSRGWGLWCARCVVAWVATVGFAAFCEVVVVVRSATFGAVPCHSARVVLWCGCGPLDEERFQLFDLLG